MPEIVLEHVTKCFGKFVAVDDLNLTIEDRDFITLLGPSGCGKTTTLRMIAGLETPTEGRITIGDTVVFDSEEGIDISPAKRDIGFLFQNYALWPHMTVYDNIAFGLENLKWPKDKIESRVREMLAMLKIVIEEDEAEIVRRIFREYAGGKFVKDIVADLTREGIYFKGKPFLSGSVYNMLQNEKYAGIFRYKEGVFTNIYPRIVPEEIYRIVRGLAAENKNGTHLPEVCYLLKDKIVCGYCGRPIASESGTARNGETIRYYKCSGRKKLQDCNKATIGKEVLESLVVDTTLQVLNDPDTVELLAERLMDAHKKRIADQTVANLLAEEKQERIITQKWIANWLLGNEAWCDFRRTGYPRLMPATEEGNKSADRILTTVGARRMEYPDDEASTNALNYQEAVSTLLGGADAMSTRLWFDRKPDNPTYMNQH